LSEVEQTKQESIKHKSKDLKVSEIESSGEAMRPTAIGKMKIEPQAQSFVRQKLETHLQKFESFS